MDKPLVAEKRVRGREMRIHELREPGKDQLMYEGYNEDKKFLVPDSKLEVMKELVNMKLGKPPRDRYLREYELIGKQKKFKANEPEEEVKPKTITFADEKKKSTESEEETSSESTSEESEIIEPRPTENFEVSDTDRLRFLLSGHIRNNLRPIFIIHKYDGQPLFGEEVVDFRSTKKERDIDLFMSGKFYQQSVLQEVNGVAKSLIIKPQRILIDERSRIYEESINMLFRIGKVELELEGQFIKQAKAKKYTPFITFKVNKSPSSPTKVPPEEISYRSSISSSSKRGPFLSLGRQVVYLVSRPKANNDIFNPKPTKFEEVREESLDKPIENQIIEETKIPQIVMNSNNEAEEKDSWSMKNYHATVSFAPPQQQTPHSSITEEKLNNSGESGSRRSFVDSSLSRISKIGSLTEDAFKRLGKYVLPKTK